MSEAGLGHWYGAYLGDKLVADLGIFCDDRLGRYQSVGTDPLYRKRGICGTLVFRAGEMATEEFALENLVMEADPGYHAARIYESVGFEVCEENYSLSWWKGKRNE